jgi:predicted transcriptional regulator
MLSKHLKKLRRDAGLTQYGLSRKTGIARWKIANAELGVRKLLPEEIESIRKVLLDSSQEKSARVIGALDASARVGRSSGTRLRSATV